MKTVIYTAITGRYDPLRSQAATGEPFVAFIDGKSRSTPPWEIRRPRVALKDPVAAARWHKMMPHWLFPDCDFSLWIDGSIEIIGKPTVEQLVDQYLGDADIILFKHRVRNCLYDEAWECVKNKKGDQDAIYRQVSKYTQEGHPANDGLAETPVILRRHNEAVKAFDLAWWEELRNHSLRDQISFNYLVRKTGIKVAYFPGTIQDNDLFKKHLHPHTFVSGNISRARKKCVVLKRTLLSALS